MSSPAVQRHKTTSGSVFLTLLAAVFALFGAFSTAFAAPNYPELQGRITDNAQLLTAADRAQIEAELKALEEKSTDQIAVVTVPSLDGYPIEDYGVGLARKWGIGQKDKDNGVLLIVAPNERKVRIEVGRRLEPQMTDTMASVIIQNAILPKFRRGDFSGGIRDGVSDIKAVLLGDAAEVAKRAKITSHDGASFAPAVHILIILAILLFIGWRLRQAAEAQRRWEQNLTPEQRRAYQRQLARRRNSGNVIIIPGGSGDWGGGWSSGGSSGGGWSGGGGSFGGGGASGSW